MKHTLFFSLILLGLAGCSSDAGSASSSDPRIDQIRESHQQLLTLQKEFAVTEKDSIKDSMALAANNFNARHRDFDEMVATSEGLLGTVNQLDADKSQDPAQAQLIGETLRREKAMVEHAEQMLQQNKEDIVYFRKLHFSLDSMKRATGQ